MNSSIHFHYLQMTQSSMQVFFVIVISTTTFHIIRQIYLFNYIIFFLTLGKSNNIQVTILTKVRRPFMLTSRSAFQNFRLEIISRRLCLSASSRANRHAWAEARNRMAKLQIRSAYIDTFPQCILYKKKTYARCRRKQTFHIRRCAFNSKNSMHLRHSRGGGGGYS